MQLLVPECVGAAVSPAGRGVEDTTLLLCDHNTLLLSPFSERFSRDGETIVWPGEPRHGKKIPQESIQSPLSHTLPQVSLCRYSLRVAAFSFFVNSSKAEAAS